MFDSRKFFHSLWTPKTFIRIAIGTLCAYGLLALALAFAPKDWSSPVQDGSWVHTVQFWLATKTKQGWFHPTAAWMAGLAALALWIPGGKSRRSTWLLPSITGVLIVALAPLFITGLRPHYPAWLLQLWPQDTLAWPLFFVLAWMASFTAITRWPQTAGSWVITSFSYVMMAAAAVGVAGNFLKLDLIYNQPLLAPIQLPLVIMLFILGLILLLRRQTILAATLSGSAREDSLISSIGLGLLVTIAFTTGLSSFIALQSQVESSLFRGQIQSMDNRIIVFYNAMDVAFNEISQLVRKPDIVRQMQTLDNQKTPITEEQKEKLLAAANSVLPFNVGAYEFRSSTGHVLAKRGQFKQVQTMWVEYRDTTEIRMEWSKGIPFIGITIPIHDADQLKIGELVVELPNTDWEKLVTDTFELGGTGSMMVCGMNYEALRCLQSHVSDKLYVPSDNSPLSTMIQDALEGERSSPTAPKMVISPSGKPAVVSYGPIGKVRIAIKAPGIGLAMLILTDADEFYEPVRQQLRRILPLLLGIIFIGGVVLRRLVVPLIRALREARQGLEIRVAERTAELSSSNQALATEVQERSQAEARFRSLTELSSDWYWEMNTQYQLMQISGEVERKGGFEASSSLGKTLWDQEWVDAESSNWSGLKAALEAREPFYDQTIKTRDTEGAARYLAISGQPFHDLNGEFVGFRGTGKDVTEKHLAQEHIHFLAHYDSLTQLPNRTLLNEHVRLAIERSKRHNHKLALLFIDLDRFKVINDSLGHDAGDEVLRIVSRCLLQSVRDSDLVSRLGGDEFVVLLDGIEDSNHAGLTARRILEFINEPFELEGTPYTVGASIGISLYPDDGDSVAELLKHSDTAMYLAKREGRNDIFFFSNALNDTSMAIFQLESDLRQALEQDQFILHYQPKVHPVLKNVVGVEALIRWHHPIRGMVSPLEFIPIAEECGLIVAMGDWVIRKALAQLAAWDAAGLPPIRMAVNLSPRQLHENLPMILETVLSSHGLQPNRLELELTESMLLQRPERDIQTLQHIQNSGVHIALDDFGTGYSSLSSLASLPLNCVKMDRAFVERLPQDATSVAISRSILTMARGIGLEVVAEGVENKEQWEWLAKEGCHQIQGYYFSKPLPPEQALKFMAEFAAAQESNKVTDEAI